MTSRQSKSRPAAAQVAKRNPAALAHAVGLIYQTCCLAAAPELIGTTANPAMAKAIAKNDTAALYDMLVASFSYQGTSDVVAYNYMQRHGTPTCRRIEAELKHVSCPKLGSYWQFDQCRYEKTKQTCSEPDHFGCCPLPTHMLRNGRLNQLAFSLYLFIRDIAAGDLVGWINRQLATVPAPAYSTVARQEVLIGPLRNVYGVSDKVVAMALSGLLIAGSKRYPAWLEVGVGMVAVDTLVHNFLHRTGILDRFDASHPYGTRCYGPGGCADILQVVSRHLDAREFDPAFPAAFPRFIQSSVWRYCAIYGRDVCNGNRINDRLSCANIHCQIHGICDRIPLQIGQFCSI